jgi:hypothetical protein
MLSQPIEFATRWKGREWPVHGGAAIRSGVSRLQHQNRDIRSVNQLTPALFSVKLGAKKVIFDCALLACLVEISLSRPLTIDVTCRESVKDSAKPL